MRTALASLIAKELRQTFRDRRMLALLVVAPVIQLVLLGYAVNLEVEHVPTIIADEDHSPESRRFAEGLVAGDAFDLVGHVPDGEVAVAAITRGQAPIAVVIPRGFGRRLVEGRTAQVQVLVDGGDSNRAIIGQNAVRGYALSESLARSRSRLAEQAAARGAALDIPTVRIEPRILYNPTLDSQVYFVPGVAATLLLVVTLIVTAMGMAREKETGTLEQVLVTPIGPTTLILGKTIPNVAIGLVDMGLVLGVGTWLFDVPVRGSLWIVFLAGLLYLLTTVGLGLFVSTAARTQQQAFMAAYFVMMPAMLLSGFMTPIDNMPGWMQPLTVVNPVRHFVEVLRAVLLKGATAMELAPQLIALAGLGVTVFTLAAGLVRRRLS